MGDYSMILKGDKITQYRFKQLSNRIQGQVMREAMKKAMEPVLVEAKKLAPEKTGKLKRTMKILSWRNRKKEIGARVVTGTRKQLGIDDNAKYYYPAAQEYGTSKMSARSFMRAALFVRKGAALLVARAEIAKLVEKGWNNGN